MFEQVDTETLAPIRTSDNPCIVAGRVLQYDADIGAYNATFDDEASFDTCIHSFLVQAETYRLMAGADKIILHLTGSGSTKAGRYDFAAQQQYQGNRNDKVAPRYLHRLRDFLANTYKDSDSEIYAINWMDREADDGMVQYQYASAVGTSIICSDDKDLRISKGLHLDWRDCTIRETTAFGGCYLDKTTSTTKVKGYGTSFFWHQLLMGDTADAIKGLATVHGSILNRVKPTKAIQSAYETLARDGATDTQIAKAQGVIDSRKAGSCGPVITHALLDGCKTDRACADVVLECYKKCYGTEEITFTWKDGTEVKCKNWQEVLHREGKLLWMQRVTDEDWFTWLREVLK